jgi:hypothetical protein
MTIQLGPAVLVEVPGKGVGVGWLVTDHGPEHPRLLVVTIKDTGEIVEVPITDCKVVRHEMTVTPGVCRGASVDN